MKRLTGLLTVCVWSLLLACKAGDENTVKADLLDCPEEGTSLYGFGGRGSIRMPNAFSPTGDGRNEVFRLVASDTGVCRSVMMRIVSADGTVLHTISRQGDSWDGYNRNAGAYYPSGRYRVDYGIVLHGGGGSDVTLSGHTCIKLYGAPGGERCLSPIGNTSQDVFEDQIDPASGGIVYRTTESYCP